MVDRRDARLVVLELLLKLGLAALLLNPSIDGFFLSLHYRYAVALLDQRHLGRCCFLDHTPKLRLA
jgi:hypothetical protein